MKCRGDPCDQYISNTRPSRFVILSAAKDLSPGSVQILRCAQDDTPASALVDSRNLLFEMYWAQAPPPIIHTAPAPTRGIGIGGCRIREDASIVVSRGPDRRKRHPARDRD